MRPAVGRGGLPSGSRDLTVADRSGAGRELGDSERTASAGRAGRSRRAKSSEATQAAMGTGAPTVWRRCGGRVGRLELVSTVIQNSPPAVIENSAHPLVESD